MFPPLPPHMPVARRLLKLLLLLLLSSRPVSSESCANGKYRSNSARNCDPHTPCAPGRYETAAPTNIADRVCTACPVGKYKTVVGQSQCQTQTTKCEPGTFLTQGNPHMMCTATCLGAKHWIRQKSDVANNAAGVRSCADTCMSQGYTYFGLECPRTTTIHCQCAKSIANAKPTPNDSKCRLEAAATELGKHCVGPYTSDAYTPIWRKLFRQVAGTYRSPSNWVRYVPSSNDWLDVSSFSALHFNANFVAGGGLLKRECSTCASSHKTIVYKRLSAMPTDKDWNDLFKSNWFSKSNKLNVDFELFSSIADATSRTTCAPRRGRRPFAS